MLEGWVKTYLGRSPAEDPPGLRPGDLEEGILAGLGDKAREKTIRKLKLKLPPLPGGAAGTGGADAGMRSTGPAAASAATAAAAAVAAAALGEEEADELLDDVAAEVEQAASAAAGPGGTPMHGPNSRHRRPAAAGADAAGHHWHGEHLVRAALAAGGEPALHDLVRRFRLAFVEACRPKYLPPGWSVEAVGERGFGAYSAYGRASGGSEAAGAAAEAALAAAATPAAPAVAAAAAVAALAAPMVAPARAPLPAPPRLAGAGSLSLQPAFSS
jgi:hypothetical protein